MYFSDTELVISDSKFVFSSHTLPLAIGMNGFRKVLVYNQSR